MRKGLLSINMKLGLFLIVLIFLCGEALSFVTISMDELEKKESLYYKVGSSEPFSGFVVDLYPNQQKKFQIEFNKGLKLSSSGWFEDGELSYTEKYDEGKLVEYIPTRNYDVKEIAEIYTVIPTMETCAFVLRTVWCHLGLDASPSEIVESSPAACRPQQWVW